MVEEEVAEWSDHDFGDHRIYGLSLFSILATVHSTCARMIVCADHKFENFLVCRSLYDSVSFIPAKDQFLCELHWQVSVGLRDREIKRHRCLVLMIHAPL